MEMKPILKNVRQLLQRKIILVDAIPRTLGVISQVFLHPPKGKLLGTAIRMKNETTPLLVALNYLLFPDLQTENEQVTVFSDSFSVVEEFETGVTTYQDFLGAEIVTDKGKLCGRIKEVYFREDNLQTVYEVKRPGLQGFIHLSYFIVGGTSDYYSHRHRRLILPVGTPRFKSLGAAIEGLQAEYLLAMRLAQEPFPDRAKEHAKTFFIE